MEVEETDEGILALVVPPVGDVALNRKMIQDIKELPQKECLEIQNRITKTGRGYKAQSYPYCSEKPECLYHNIFGQTSKEKLEPPSPSKQKGMPRYNFNNSILIPY